MQKYRTKRRTLNITLMNHQHLGAETTGDSGWGRRNRVTGTLGDRETLDRTHNNT